MDRNRQLITGLGVALFLTCVVLIGTYWFYPRQQAAESALAARAMDFDPFAELEARQRPSVSEIPFAEDVYADQAGDDAQVKAQDQTVRQELHEDGITIVFGIRDDEPVSRADRQRPSGIQAEDVRSEQEPEHGAPVADAAQDTRDRQPVSSSDHARTESTTETVRQATPSSTVSRPPTAAAPTSTAAAVRPAVSSSTASRQPSAAARAEREFWVQIFSGRSRGGADAAREKFYEETSMHPLMTTIDHEGQIFYRLRVGPYIDRRDAEQLLAGLSAGSFGESYISIVYN